MERWSIDAAEWAVQQFGECRLGDARRTKRLTRLAQQVAENPSSHFPEQAGSWADVKAAYRLFDAEDVTFERIATPHWERTRAESPPVALVIGDTTELDFGIHRQIKNLSRTGNGGGWGFLLHSALLVDAESESVVGLAGQTIHYRQPAPPGENNAQRLQRRRESEIWGAVCDRVGPPPDGVRWIHVDDRGADNFEVFVHFQQNRADWVVRVAQRHRTSLDPQGRERPLQECLDDLPPAGTFELDLRARPGQAARTARLEVFFGRLAVPLPRHRSPYVKQHASGPIAMQVVHVREVDPPTGIEPLDWVLLTSLPVESFAEALQVVQYYAKRWLIEEWHKAIKTGCRVTERQLQTRERLEPMVALLGIVGVRLLQLKSVARTMPERPALSVVPESWVLLLCAARKRQRSARTMTVGDFYRGLAQLGGFLGRRHDGEPGWMTIWRGWEKLHLMIRGSELLAQTRQPRQRCG